MNATAPDSAPRPVASPVTPKDTKDGPPPAPGMEAIPGAVLPLASVTPPSPTSPQSPTSPARQARNPLHGVTLETMVVGLADYFGWDELGQQIPIRCFQSDPSVGSSLKFLRKTPWAREKVESLYLFMLRDQRRNAQE